MTSYPGMFGQFSARESRDMCFGEVPPVGYAAVTACQAWVWSCSLPVGSSETGPGGDRSGLVRDPSVALSCGWSRSLMPVLQGQEFRESYEFTRFGAEASTNPAGDLGT